MCNGKSQIPKKEKPLMIKISMNITGNSISIILNIFSLSYYNF